MITSCVTFEIAEMLKKCGYPQEMSEFVFVEGLGLIPRRDVTSFQYAAPAYDDVVQWFIDEHDLYISPLLKGKGNWSYTVYLQHKEYTRCVEYATASKRSRREVIEHAITYLCKRIMKNETYL